MARKTQDASTASDTRPSDVTEAAPRPMEAGSDLTPPPTEKPKPVWVELFDLDRDTAKNEEIQSIIDRDMLAVFGNDPLVEQANVRLFFDSRAIGSPDSDRIYKSFKGVDRSRPILLVVKSGGGSIEAAFFVAKVCRENTEREFAIAVPREAKSAATLMCCGADKIHMGSLSELGPIDPQFGGTPALALKHSVEHIAELASQYPGAAGMLTDYLTRTLRIESLGYYERVAASAVQYAVRLLKSRAAGAISEEAAESIARRLVYAYKDHGFVIDSREASDIFGQDIVACNTPEYEFANRLHTHIDLLNYITRQTLGREIAFVGLLDKCEVFRIKDESRPVA